MGMAEQKLEMLFISPEASGKGFGKKLLQYGTAHYSIPEAAANEQNLLAKGFYEHRGFQVYKRTSPDEQGAPYPLLYIKLSSCSHRETDKKGREGGLAPSRPLFCFSPGSLLQEATPFCR